MTETDMEMVIYLHQRHHHLWGSGRGGIPRLNVIKFGLKCQTCQTETKNVKNSDA